MSTDSEFKRERVELVAELRDRIDSLAAVQFALGREAGTGMLSKVDALNARKADIAYRINVLISLLTPCCATGQHDPVAGIRLNPRSGREIGPLFRMVSIPDRTVLETWTGPDTFPFEDPDEYDLECSEDGGSAWHVLSSMRRRWAT